MPDWLTADDQTNESFLVTDIARILRRRFDLRAKGLGLTRAQWQVLGTLRRCPGISQARLADKLEVRPITLTRLLDRLEKTGWVERRLDADDRRVRRLFLTDQVASVVRRMRTLGLDLRQEAMTGLSQQEHAILLGLLQRIKANLCPHASEELNV
jgi:MarR family transcriptional regulator, transcriptional regulator for hemolysin